MQLFISDRKDSRESSEPSVSMMGLAEIPAISNNVLLWWQ